MARKGRAGVTGCGHVIPMSPSIVPFQGPAATAPRAPVHDGRPNGERQRALLVALVAANPGVHILRASNLLGLNWNTCLHHVRRLEGMGQLTVRKVNGRVCLFDRRGGAASNRLGTLLLRDARNAEVAKVLAASPGINQKALAQRVGIAPSVCHYRLVRLEEAGLVQRANHGREVAVFPTDAMLAALRQSTASPMGGLPTAATTGPTGPLAPLAGAGILPHLFGTSPAVTNDATTADVPELPPALRHAAALPFDVDAPVAEP